MPSRIFADTSFVLALINERDQYHDHAEAFSYKLKPVHKSSRSVEVLEMKDSLLREFAFTESKARDYIEKQCGGGEMKTITDEINALREALGLPGK